MTPRQLRVEMLLMRRRRLHEMAESLMIAVLGACTPHGGGKEADKVMKDWSRM